MQQRAIGWDETQAIAEDSASVHGTHIVPGDQAPRNMEILKREKHFSLLFLLFN